MRSALTQNLNKHINKMIFQLNLIFLLNLLLGSGALPSEKQPIEISSAKLPIQRLIGGHEAWPHSHPYIVSLQLRIFGLRVHYCGGSLLNKLWVLTAGHCVRVSWFYQLFPLDIAAGAYNIYYPDMMTQFRTVAKRVPHPQYSGGISEHDIALLKVNLPFVFTSAVQPIRLPVKTITKHNNLVLAGWGALKTTYILPAMPDLLQEMKVSYISYEDCYRALEDIEEEAEKLLKENVHICTGPLYGGIAACSGDSGGPLIEYFYVNANDSNVDFNFIESLEVYDAIDEEISHNTPGSFWSQLQQMINRYIYPQETFVESSFDNEEPSTLNSDTLVEKNKLKNERQFNVQTDKVPVVVGVVSWGITPCGYKGAPSVYTNVSHYLHFIKNHIDT